MVAGAVLVRVAGVAAVATDELSLVLAVAAFAVATQRTGLAAVARVNRDDGHTRKPRLVVHERAQLLERPVAEPSPLPVVNRWLAAGADPGQFLDRDPFP